MIGEFDKRDTAVIAVAQEDTALESHAKFLDHFGGRPAFDIVADLNREVTQRYDHTTTYLVDKQGVVREIFPGTVRARPSWYAVLREIDMLDKKPSAGREPQDGPAKPSGP